MPRESRRGALRSHRLPARSFYSVALLVLLVLGLPGLTGCQSAEPLPPIRTATDVDLSRFMGDWYVLGNIPTFIETRAYNAVESYAMNDDGSIATTFSFRKGSFDGPEKVYHPKGFVRHTPATTGENSNAVWGMQFIWPFKAEYRVLYVSENYEQTVIGRSKRDYLWIMARTPELAESEYAALVEFASAEGYDPSKIRRVPQQSSQSTR